MKFTLGNIALATTGKLLNSSDRSETAHCIHTDSRRITKSDSAAVSRAIPTLFWALKGDTFDGHDFVEQAIAQGADAVLIGESFATSICISQRIATIVVKDTAQALNDLAMWHRNQSPARVIGVTGSFGKTTTREMIFATLEANLPCYQSPASFNNHFGVPFSLLGIERTHEAAVIELGASTVGEIESLCKIAQPNVGVITGIGKAHVDRFGSLKRTVQAKKELAQSIPRDGVIVLPGDCEFCDELARDLDCQNIVRAGLDSSKNDIFPGKVRVSNDELCATLEGFSFRTKASGSHFAQSILSAIVVARHFGLSNDQIAAGLAAFVAPPGRCQVKRFGTWTVIDDTYNASPEAMQAACKLLGNWQTFGPRVLVCGDMLELGSEAIRCHEETAIAATENGLDYILAFGEFASVVTETAIEAGFNPGASLAFRDQGELVAYLKTILCDDVVILVKGSRKMRAERVVSAIEATWQEQRTRMGELSGQAR